MFQNKEQEIDIDSIFANAKIGNLEIRTMEKSVRHQFSEPPAFTGTTTAKSEIRA